jgi:hypothetical protein
MASGARRGMLPLEDYRNMRTILVLVCSLTLFPTLMPAGPRHIDRTQNHRVHFATGTRWARSMHRGYYCFNGANWVVVPLSVSYGGIAAGGDFVYQGREVSDDVYPYAQSTSNPDIVVSPFAPNALIDVSGIPSGAKVRDPVSEEVFLRP